MAESIGRRSAAWLAALICATLVSALPARGGVSGAARESASPGAVARVTPAILDPTSGRQIAVWSEFDGLSNKIAYARLERGVWTDYHYLTFGPERHTEPRVGITRDGAYLFWIVDGGRYVYAPLDLARGRLHAAPQRVPLESAGLYLAASAHSGSITIDGGSDTPVVTECPPDDANCELLGWRNDPRRPVLSDGGSDTPVVTECPPDDANCELLGWRNAPRRPVLSDGGSDTPVVAECPPDETNCEVLISIRNVRRRAILSEGGSDTPIVLETGSLWSVSSRPSCNLMVLSIPSSEAGAYHMLRFEEGRIGRAGRVRLLPDAAGVLPAATAAAILDSGCF